MACIVDVCDGQDFTAVGCGVRFAISVALFSWWSLRYIGLHQLVDADTSAAAEGYAYVILPYPCCQNRSLSGLASGACL
jgi:hypothetical protein